MKKLHKTHILFWLSILAAMMAPVIAVWPQTSINIDRITQRQLDELERMVNTAPPDEIQESINRVINSAGFIPQLAKIFYLLAQNEDDIDTLTKHYGAILKNWPESAWAQKAVVEFIPLIFMSGGKTDPSFEDLIWAEEEELLKPSEDAISIGEDPNMLRADVFLQLILLSHHRNQPSKVLALKDREDQPSLQDRKDIVDLAVAYAEIRSMQNGKAEALLLEWLKNYPQSEVRALALLALYQVSDREEQKQLALGAIRQEFADTLEGYQLKESLNETDRQSQ